MRIRKPIQTQKCEAGLPHTGGWCRPEKPEFTMVNDDFECAAQSRNSRFFEVSTGLLILLLIVTGIQDLFSQRFLRATKVDLFIEGETRDGVKLKGQSREVELQYPPGAGLMVLHLDPKTIITDNLTFNKHMEDAFLGAIHMELPFQTEEIEYRSMQNERFDTEGLLRLNNREKKIKVSLNITSNKSNLRNMYSISGLVIVRVSDFTLEEHFPELSGSIKFEFSQTVEVNY